MASSEEAERLRQEARKAEATAKNQRDREHAKIAERMARERIAKNAKKN